MVKPPTPWQFIDVIASLCVFNIITMDSVDHVGLQYFARVSDGTLWVDKERVRVLTVNSCDVWPEESGK